MLTWWRSRTASKIFIFSIWRYPTRNCVVFQKLFVELLVSLFIRHIKFKIRLVIMHSLLSRATRWLSNGHKWPKGFLVGEFQNQNSFHCLALTMSLLAEDEDRLNLQKAAKMNKKCQWDKDRLISICKKF